MQTGRIISYAIWGLIVAALGAAAFGGVVKTVRVAYDQFKPLSAVIADMESDNIASLSSFTEDVVFPVAQKEVEFVEVAPKETNKKVSLLFVGDIMLDRGVEQSVIENGDGDFSFIFKYLKFLGRTDITFGNLEGPVSDKGKDRRNLYSFRMPPEAFEALRGAGFDALSVANNHAGDWGREAFEDALFRLKNEEILAVGGGWNKVDAEKVKVIEKNGLRFGFLGFTDVGPKWLEVGEDQSGILIVKKGYLEIVKKAAEEVDYLIVSFHFGNEYQTEPSERQRYIGEAVIDSGAKIVIGHHPHVVQPIRNYHGGIIAYSLGNFIFDQYFSEETMQGMVLEVIVDKKGIIEASKEFVNLNDHYQPSL